MNPELPSAPSSEQVAAFFQKHRTGLFALVFTDLVDSVALVRQLGDQAGATFLQRRRQLVRDTLRAIPEGEEIETAGDSFLLIFSKPSDAVRFALLAQAKLREFAQGSRLGVQERMGIHLGEVVIAEHETETKAKDLYGIQISTCARVMSLAQGGQILLTRGVFDSARQVLKGEDIPGVGPLNWVSHGPYVLKGIEEAVEVCEVGEAGRQRFEAPKTSEKAQRAMAAGEEPVLGWRPAVGQEVPNTKWLLEEKLGEGGFGEVWRAQHRKMKESRVFKFCFRADRVRTLKRELTLFRLLKEHVGEHASIVRLHEVYLDEPPYYLEEEYVEGKDLKTWCEAQDGVEKVPLETRLEIIAQAAEGLQAAHDAGIIHRDVKPGNILIAQRAARSAERRPGEGLSESGIGGSGDPLAFSLQPSAFSLQPSALAVKLTDFGIGQVVSAEVLAGVTRSGFTQTMLSSTSSQTGTHLYMAPELSAGEPASTRSDIYSLGVVLYQLLLGDFKRPVTGDWPEEIPEPLLQDDLKHCLAGRPAGRFMGAGQLARNLRELPQRQADRREREQERQRAARKHKLVLVGSIVIAGLVLLAGALGYGLSEARRSQRELEQNLYAADIKLAQEALDINDLGHAKRLLEQYAGPAHEHLRGWEWRYLWQECQSDALGVLCRYSNSVYSVALSPDGKRLAVAGFIPSLVELWDVPGRKRIATLQENEGHVVAFSPRTDLLATDADQGVIRIWRISTTNLVGQITHPGSVKVLRFSPDGTWLASLNNRGEAAVWEVGQWDHPVRRIPGPGSGSTFFGSLDFSPDSRALAVGDPEGRIRVVDLETGQERFCVPAHSEPITFVAWSPKAPLIASGSGYSSGLIRLWDADSGKASGTLEGHSSWVCELLFSADGQWLYSASADQTIRIWDVGQRQCLATLSGSTDEVWGLTLAPDGRTLVSTSKDGVVAFWSALPRPEVEQPRVVPLGRSAAPAFAPDGRALAVPREGTVHLYELPGFREIERIPALGTNASAVAYSPDGTLLVSGSRNGWLRVWSGVERRLLCELAGHQRGMRVVRFRRDGNRLFALDQEGNATWWDVHTWQPVRRFAVRTPVVSGALSPDGRRLASGNSVGQVEWWDAETGDYLASRTGHRHRVVGIAFSTDATRAGSVGEDGTVSVWDTSSFEQIVGFKGHMQGAHGVVFSPDGRRLATGGGARDAVKLWDLRTHRELLTLPGQGSLFTFLAFSPDGNWLAAPNSRGQLHVWHTPSSAKTGIARETAAHLPPP